MIHCNLQLISVDHTYMHQQYLCDVIGINGHYSLHVCDLILDEYHCYHSAMFSHAMLTYDLSAMDIIQ